MNYINYIAHFLALSFLGFFCYLVFPNSSGIIPFGILAIFYILYSIRLYEKEERKKKESAEKFENTMRTIRQVQEAREREERKKEIELQQIELRKKIEKEELNKISSTEEDILIL